MSEANDNLLQAVTEEVQFILDPLSEVDDDPRALLVLMAKLGWNFEGLLTANVDAVSEAIEGVRDAIATVASSSSVDSLENVSATLNALDTALQRLQDVQQALAAASSTPQIDADTAKAIIADLLEYLIIVYLARRSPTLVEIAALLTLIGEEQPAPLLSSEGTGRMPLRYPAARPALNLRNLSRLLSDPVNHLKSEYFPEDGNIATDADAQALADRLFGRLKALVVTLGGEAMVGLEGASRSEVDDPLISPLHRMMTFAFPIHLSDTGADVSCGATLEIVPATTTSPTDDRGPGLAVSPFGLTTLRHDLAGWNLVLQVGGTIGEFFINSKSVRFADGAQGRLEVLLSFTRATADGQAWVVGPEEGSRLEVGRSQVAGELSLVGNDPTFGVLLEFDSAALVVSAGDGDGFLQQVLGEGLRTDFDLALGWSNRTGLHFRGSAGLEATLPVKASVLGLITVDSVYMALRAEEPAVEAVLATTASVNLGPFTAGIERVGLRAEFTFPETGGNLGPANVELDFKPPNGVGLAIDSGVIVGGGYLFFNPENEQYAGILQLEFGETISLTAIGLLTTNLPGGSPGGFSLLAIIFAEGFSPISLGFGFTLNGVGGLLGANRTAMVDTMRAGLKNGTMDSILFPSDPIRNAPRIISDLSTVFPPAPERHLFGPMAIIGWGSPTLLTLEIALLLELPEPVRLILLGRLTAMLPSEEEALVRVRMDAIGVVDFGRGEISLDASLYDSRILMFALTGDMAMRVSLGERPNFVLAIGGFNPRFAAPPGLPRLSRLALSLATGDNPRLRLEAYLALTSNTVQFGARLELLATAGPFSLEGLLGFDAMFQFDPFQFIADLVAGVALRYEGRILMAVHLDAALSGPAPWHVRGSASFQFLLFKVSVAFDASFGPQPPPAQLPKAANVLDMLAEALADPGNWSGELVPNARPLVSLRPAPNGVQTLLVHPLARPTVRQRVAPLGQTIEKFGNRRLEAGPRAYTVAAVAEDGHPPLSTTAVGDMFALGQFREMSDDQKLSRPSFERFDSGLCFGDDTLVYHHDRATDGTFGYEQRTIDPGAADGAIRRVEEQHLMSAAVFDAVVGLGAAGQAPVRRTGAARYRDAAPMVGSPVTR